MHNILYILVITFEYTMYVLGKLEFETATLSLLFITGIYLACKH